MPGEIFATLMKGLHDFAFTNAAQLLQSCAFEEWDAFSQGCQAQPWAGTGERFQRYSFLMSSLKSGCRFYFLCKASQR